jgi:ClpP class serine protease
MNKLINDEDREIVSGSFENFLDKCITEVGENEGAREKYDIDDANDLVLWTKGQTLSPGLEKALKQIKKFIEEEVIAVNEVDFTKFHNNSSKYKMRQLIEINKSFYICKDSWEYFERNLDNQFVVNRVMGLLCIKADEKRINKLCKSLLNNLQLFETFILN